jgi:hypothetical protein
MDRIQRKWDSARVACVDFVFGAISIFFWLRLYQSEGISTSFE